MSSSTKPYRVILSGYYGCGNAGDEAVLAGIRDAFNLVAPGRVTLTAFSQNPEETKKNHGIDAVYRMSPTILKQTIANSDLLISGGGSLLQDTTSLKSLLYYLYVMRIAHAKRVPFMFYAQGIGPLRRPLSRKLVQIMANKAAWISVRDKGSESLLNQIGVSRTQIEVTEDPAFALIPDDGAASEILEQEKIPLDKPLIAVSLRPWGPKENSPLQLYRKLLLELEERTASRILLLPMHHPDDLEFSESVDPDSRYAVLKGVYPPDAILGIVKRMHAVIGMRLHALIFAARVTVPLFALSYDPKVAQLMNRLDMKDSTADWKEFDPANIANKVALMLQDREGTISLLTDKAGLREAAALRNAEIAIQILEKN